jgi:hypothetical protein
MTRISHASALHLPIDASNQDLYAGATGENVA